MSSEFTKRVKKSTTIKYPEGGEEATDEVGVCVGGDLRPSKGFEFKRKTEDKKPTQLQKRFAEAEKNPAPESPKPMAPSKDQETSAPDPRALSFLDSDDAEAKYLKAIIENGQRIVNDNAQKKINNTGIREIPLPLPDRLQHHRVCDAAFDAKIDDLLRAHFFPKGVQMIPDEDLIAKGDIFVVPKFLRANQAESEAPIEERLKKFLDKR